MTSEHEDAAQRERDAWGRLGDALSNRSWQAQENRYQADSERYETGRARAAGREIDRRLREYREREQER